MQWGVVFKLDPTGIETVLHTFDVNVQGENPGSGVVRDPAGNLFGTTIYGGLNEGVVFKINVAGIFSVLHQFNAPTDGGSAYAGVSLDGAGNMYGTTVNYGPGGGGTVYKLDTNGIFSVLYDFSELTGGSGADGGVTVDASGNLYGTAENGGLMTCDAGIGCGTVYEINAAGQFTVLHTFTGGADGSQPFAGVSLGGVGKLYGTTSAGGASGGGVLYEMVLP
jgi:uncharacterized repeat protein (TIGR03803 family)